MDSGPVRWKRCQRLGGGSISDAYLIELSPCGELFVKLNNSDFVTAFELEQDGLDALGAVGEMRVPEAIAVECIDNQALFICEAIKTSPRTSTFFVRFGRQLAEFHRASRALNTTNRFGYHRDNFLGSANQLNAWRDSWLAFFAECRLEFQIRWAEEQGLFTGDLRDMLRRLLGQLPSYLQASTERPVLIHGDLWSGNYLCDLADQPVLVDPACYWADREAEFGMLTWMGGCPREFYDAYNACWPLADGWQQRVKIYRLYHELNHLNLFGSGYQAGCLQTTQEILSCR